MHAIEKRMIVQNTIKMKIKQNEIILTVEISSAKWTFQLIKPEKICIDIY